MHHAMFLLISALLIANFSFTHADYECTTQDTKYLQAESMLDDKSIDEETRYSPALIFFDDAINVNPDGLNAYIGKAYASHCINDYQSKMQAIQKYSEITGENLEFPSDLCYNAKH